MDPRSGCICSQILDSFNFLSSLLHPTQHTCNFLNFNILTNISLSIDKQSHTTLLPSTSFPLLPLFTYSTPIVS